MTSLESYLQDGANYQARAVLMFLQSENGLEISWSKEKETYEASPSVSRWENCREQGYLVSLRSKDYSRQLNLAFFEHRNSDSICAVKWEQVSMNSLTIDTARFGEVYRTKWETSHSVSCGEVQEMAIWLAEQMHAFWLETSTPKDKGEEE